MAAKQTNGHPAPPEREPLVVGDMVMYLMTREDWEACNVVCRQVGHLEFPPLPDGKTRLAMWLTGKTDDGAWRGTVLLDQCPMPHFVVQHPVRPGSKPGQFTY